MAATFLFVRGEAIQRAEQTGRFHTRFVADSILRDRLRASDFAGPATGARRAQLDALAHRELLPGGALRANLYGPGGRVVYSTDHALIGTRPDEPDTVLGALRGRLASDVTHLGAEDDQPGGVKVLESYVPVTLRGQHAPVGVFELYQDYAPIASSARQTFVPIASMIALALLLLYLSFFPILRRVTARIRHQMEQIEHQAFHDALTGLPNRSLFHDRVEHALRAARRDSQPVAVMVMDLDRFKEVNDTLGHQSGDRAARRGRARLARPAARGGHRRAARRRRVRRARARPPTTRRARSRSPAACAPRSAAAPGRGRSRSTSTRASGSRCIPTTATTSTRSLRRADIAMYVSKETHAPALYAPEPTTTTRSQRLALIAQLRRAIAQREITVYYQPQADLRSGRDPQRRGARALGAPRARPARRPTASSRWPSTPA